MVWFNVDDGFANSKPVLKIPRRYRCAAIGLWTLAGSWSAKELTDGFIPDNAIEEFAGTAQLAEHLVRAGLWARVDEGWQFEGWAKWQKTKEKVLAYREREAEKKRAARSKGGAKGVPTNGLVESYSDPKSSLSESSHHSPEDSRLGKRDGYEPDAAGQLTVSPGDSLGTQSRIPRGQDRESPMCPGQPIPIPIPNQEKKDLLNPDGLSDIDPLAHITEDDYPDTFKPIYSATFEQFWEQYPRKVGKRRAFTAWKSARKRASTEEILIGAKRYAADPNRDDKFTKHPDGWLNRDGWLDEDLPGVKTAVDWESL